jgi:hypothetical protein
MYTQILGKIVGYSWKYTRSAGVCSSRTDLVMASNTRVNCTNHLISHLLIEIPTHKLFLLQIPTPYHILLQKSPRFTHIYLTDFI